MGDVLEIGPGRGDLLLHLASTQPSKKFIALEIGKKYTLRIAAVEPETHRISLKVWHEREEPEEPPKEATTEKGE